MEVTMSYPAVIEAARGRLRACSGYGRLRPIAGVVGVARLSGRPRDEGARNPRRHRAVLDRFRDGNHLGFPSVYTVTMPFSEIQRF